MIRMLRIFIVASLLLTFLTGIALAQPAARTPAPPTASPAVAVPAAVKPAPVTSAPVASAPETAASPAAAPAAAETPAPPEAALATAPTPSASADGNDESDRPRDELLVLDPKTKEDLEQRLKSLDSAGLNDEDKTKAVAFYQQAIESYDVAVQQITAAQGFEKQLKELPAETATYSERLAKPLPPAQDVSGESLAAVEERAANNEVSLAHCRKELAAMIAEPKRRAQRISEMPKQIADAQLRLKELTADLDAIGSEEVSDVVTIARRASLLQAQTAVRAALQLLGREQRLYADGAQLIKLRRDYYARYVPNKEKRLAQLQSQISERRQNEAASQVAAAAKAVEDAASQPTVSLAQEKLVALAQDNKVLAERRTEVVAELNAIAKELSVSTAALRDLSDKYAKAVEQDQVDELAAVNGQLLREQQAKLPNLRALRRHRVQREARIADILLEQFELIDQQSQLSNLNDLADKLAAEAGDLSDATRTSIRQLLEAKRELLEQLVDNFNDYSGKLAKLQTNETQLIAETDRYAGFIAERVLWIRSCQPLSRADWLPALDAGRWSLDPANWRDAGRTIVQSAQAKPGQVALFIIGFTLLLVAQRPARNRLRELGEEAAKRGCIRLRPTVDALWLTIVLALPGPTLLACLGWTMDSLSSTEFVRSLSASLRFTAVCWLLIELTRHLCRRGGLADAHFDWSEACLHHLRRRMNWLAVFSLPLVLWLVGLDTQQQDPTTITSHWSSSLGRVLFITVMLSLSKFLHRILLAKKSPFRQVNFIGGGWLKPLKVVWRPAVTFLPATLAVMAAVGYYYTAMQSAVRILETVAMLLAVSTLGGLTRRWLLVNRRQLAREQAKQRRAQLLAAVETDSADPPAPEAADDTVDLAALSEQTQTLVRTFLGFTTAVGLFFIWAAVLPALAYPAGHKLPGAEMLTWGHLASFLIVLAVTFVSVRDIPALLELAILQHLPLDGGTRYAFTSISRYVLAALGLIVAFNCLDGDWGKIQWLVAAMSVGLGFGLQEIFANFVSGIILLFERPIRVGDIVTLGDKTGVVNRIRMRATTIIDWDRKEYIVPNKDLVTERLLNWTLSDQMNRIEVVLFLSHGADTDRACELLLESAREQTHLLTEPSPSAVFEGITEAGLKVALRCFLPTLEHRGATIHQLYSTIDRKLRNGGIEVASPPREMKVRFLRDQHGHPIPAPHAQFSGKSDAASSTKNGKHSAA
ncbi:mechanosensitive ion channel domain-containing protein [Lacipirellula sp.]|uniref:mechanosensitive ion channel domain-containing protein n=1 Tax=Lacipirellula sp. TaxID=2691419 RepID=UPI003D13CC12